ncbi:MAG TPA: response regulator transcription factor [Variovorax sp.]|nr:response regulator transcription factor [Variovorax sp.]
MHTEVFTEPPKPCAVLVVEDDVRSRDAFERSVRAHPGLHWLAGLGTVREALAWLAAATEAPDVLLADLGLPDGSGLDVIRATVGRFPRCDPLVISVHGDAASVLASIEAGAVGYLHKDAPPADIARTILDVKAGASPISPMIARCVLTKYRSLSLAVTTAGARGGATVALRGPLPSKPEIPGFLSAREQEVLDLIARGFSYAEIARLKNLSVNTVQTHIKNLYGKLAVHSKNEAVFEATRLGLLRHPD